MKKLVFSIFISLFVLTSCQKALMPDIYRGDDFFYLKNDEAIMPVWVRGNLESKTFCIFLHGGPGLSSLTYATNNAYLQLQEEYAFVFWDQRASGASQGNAQPETISLDQFVDDTDKLIDLICSKYEVDEVFLIGKSWGGALGTAYLLEAKHQEKVKGWVEVAGSHNWKRALELSVEYMKIYSQTKIDENESVNYWEKILKWYNENGAKRDFNFWKNHGKYLNAANAIYKDPANDPGDGIDSWNAPIPLLSILNGVYVSAHMLDEMSNLNLTPEMHKINIPTLILWGEFDFNIPVETGIEGFEAIGTIEEDKSIYIFENSAHSPSFEEPDLFVQKVKEFIEKYQ